MAKLVNYIRSEVKVGKGKPDVSSKSAFEDDRYLLPTLEDDALLYSLQDVVGHDLDDDEDDVGGVPVKALNGTGNSSNGVNRAAELEQQLQRALLEREACKRELETLRHGMEARNGLGGASKDIGEDHWDNGNENIISNLGMGPSKNGHMLGNTDTSYFASYSGHGEVAATLTCAKTERRQKYMKPC